MTTERKHSPSAEGNKPGPEKAGDADYKELSAPFIEGAPEDVYEQDGEYYIKLGKEFTIVLPAVQSTSYTGFYFQFGDPATGQIYTVPFNDYEAGRDFRLHITEDQIAQPFQEGARHVVKTVFWRAGSEGSYWGLESVPYTFVA